MTTARPIHTCEPNIEESVVVKVKCPWVLVAEDDCEMLRLLSSTLTRDGYDVLTAGSGLELFDRLRQARDDEDLPTLLVSDIRMPGLTGLQVLGTIRRWGLSIPVILITAFPDEATLSEAEQYGAAAVLGKPFDMDDLRTAVLYLYTRPERAEALNRTALI
jgi:CheY-like chemotaxis protein